MSTVYLVIERNGPGNSGFVISAHLDEEVANRVCDDANSADPTDPNPSTYIVIARDLS